MPQRGMNSISPNIYGGVSMAAKKKKRSASSRRRSRGSSSVDQRRMQQGLLACLAVFVVVSVVEWIIHGGLLKEIYTQTATVWRPPAESKQLMWYMFVAYAIFAPFFTLIYTHGYERNKTGWEQGLRYGLLVGLMIGPMAALIWYMVLPIPGKLAFYWFLDTVVMMVAAGLAVGAIYREGR
jgi:hypothetical protein